mmetsp:Transcript_3323/g.5922  ORF Transcript_3323/g.5922 Transcript_3323/m.5922 type:complete len:107 (+) Transcript_3323:149-469(+)
MQTHLPPSGEYEGFLAEEEDSRPVSCSDIGDIQYKTDSSNTHLANLAENWQYRIDRIIKTPKAENKQFFFSTTNPMYHDGAEIVPVIVHIFLLLADSTSHQISTAW